MQPHGKYFEDAIQHAFHSLGQSFVFKTANKKTGQKAQREDYLTKYMRNRWPRPPQFVNSLVIREYLGDREADLVRYADKKPIACCELKIYPTLTVPNNPDCKTFTVLADAVLKQLIRRAGGIDVAAYVAIALRKEKDELATIRRFKNIVLGNLQKYLRVECDGLTKITLRQHTLFTWKVN